MNLKASRFLDPKSDLVFKKIFGEHEDILKSFLNNILPLADDALIDEITYMTPEQVPTIPVMRRTVVDVKCKDQKGRIFIVEMQLDWSVSFMKRLQFGAAKAFISQLDKGEDYASLCPVYGLGLIGDIFDKETSEWYHHYKTVSMADTNKQLEGLEYIFLELPKFKPTTHMEKRLGVLWLRFLNEITNMVEVPKEFSDVPELCKAIELVQEASYTRGELEAYDQYWDEVSIRKTREVDAKAAITNAIAKGKAEGVTQVALRMLDENEPDVMILKYAGISKEELAVLKSARSKG
jgi:predicted transposase/invertase (TIGR01784 family)